MQAEPYQVEPIDRGASKRGAVVGVIGRLEHLLDVDRGPQLARQRPQMGAPQLLERGAEDEDRLADQGAIGTSGSIDIEFALEVAFRRRQAARQESSNIGEAARG